MEDELQKLKDELNSFKKQQISFMLKQKFRIDAIEMDYCNTQSELAGCSAKEIHERIDEHSGKLLDEQKNKNVKPVIKADKVFQASR